MPSAPMNLLLVDDDPVSREILRKILESLLKHTVTVAKDGEEGWHIVRDSGQVFDAAFIDIQMPGVDGLQLAELIRAGGLPNPPPIILCTALADRPTVAKAASLGIRHYLLKPCSPAKVLEKLQAAVGVAAGPPERTAEPPGGGPTLVAL
jgi:CheY-like chemotaxis protein